VGKLRQRRTPAINHAPYPFIENKRYRRKPRELDDVVNRNSDSVYQTDAIFALSWSRAKRAAPAHPRRKQYEYVDEENVFRAPRERLLVQL
jgi:hypothetical protein